EAPFDVEMDVLELARPWEIAALDFGADGFQPAFDGREVVGGQYAHGGQHAGVRERTPDVHGSQPAVEIHRRGVALDECGDRLAEAARPSVERTGLRWVLTRRLGVGQMHSDRLTAR